MYLITNDEHQDKKIHIPNEDKFHNHKKILKIEKKVNQYLLESIMELIIMVMNQLFDQYNLQQ